MVYHYLKFLNLKLLRDLELLFSKLFKKILQFILKKVYIKYFQNIKTLNFMI